MQGYSKVSLAPSITVRYNSYVDTSMQVYSKGSVGSSITVRYNG
jgi:hypothetical protein